MQPPEGSIVAMRRFAQQSNTKRSLQDLSLSASALDNAVQSVQTIVANGAVVPVSAGREPKRTRLQCRLQPVRMAVTVMTESLSLCPSTLWIGASLLCGLPHRKPPRSERSLLL